MIEPIIKWSGSKRSQAKQIVSFFPKTIQTYYEPFVGGASVLFTLLERHWDVQNYIASDICLPLIQSYWYIQTDPLAIINHYRLNWELLKNDRNHYYVVRDRFNAEKSPLDFIFLTRTCINGLIRFNGKGEFNTSLHITRGGIHPERFSKIILRWNRLLQRVTFLHQDYRKIKFDHSNDFGYFDPPYDQSENAMYDNQTPFQTTEFFQWLDTLSGDYILSYNGKKTQNPEVLIPKQYYDSYNILKAGVSAHRKVNYQKRVLIYEYLYIRRKHQTNDKLLIPTKISEFWKK